MTIQASAKAVEQNVRLYPWYTALFNAFFWMPVFFLYLGAHLPLSQVLLLEGIYYAAVVIVEVPSGYLSDRAGRKPTLLASSALLVISYVVFFTGSDFADFAVAQVLLAAGVAFNSGTDTSFHYDSLAASGRQAEYAQREAVVARGALGATALSALLGGAAASIELSYAYALSAVAAAGSFGLALFFAEPIHESSETAARFLPQLKSCFAHLKRPALAWLFGFAVLVVVINHVPYEFYQPYLDILGVQLGLAAHTPIATGAHAAAATLLGAWVAGHSARIDERLGTGKTLLLAALIQLAIIATMASVLHVAVVALLLLRGVPSGLYKAPLNAAVTPRIPQQERATYLSIQSLAGRLGFAMLLAGLSHTAGGAGIDNWPAQSEALLICLAVGAAGLVLLGLWLLRIDLNR